MEIITEPSWRRSPTHFTTESNGQGGTQCVYGNYVKEGICATCEGLLGAIQLASKDTHGSDVYTFINYWQIDEDAEHLLCEECYEDTLDNNPKGITQ